MGRADVTAIGCFQCSKRRITCDRAEPSCGKCIKKGIQCSGLARIRFNEGVARRGRLKNCTIPVPAFANHGEISSLLPTEVTFPELQWNSHSPPRNTQPRRVGAYKRRAKSARCPQSAVADHPESVPCLSPELPITDCTVTLPSHESIEDQDLHPDQSVPPIEGEAYDEEVETTLPAHVEPQPTPYTSYSHSVVPWIAPISSEIRGLFYHCEHYCSLLDLECVPRADVLAVSEAVAPVMVILDKVSNGYREFILPMAFQDEVLCRAVAVVAAQHLSQGHPTLELAAEKGRTAVISRLRRDASLESQVFNEFTWATLIVLLVGETVTGNADYSFLVQMLLCLSNNNAIGTKESSLTQFLRAQTHM